MSHQERIVRKAGEGAAQSQRIVVLAVHDDPELKEIFRVLGRRRNFFFRQTTDTEEAKRLVGEERPEVALVDMDVVPDVTFVRGFRRQAIRVIILSSSGDVLQAEELLEYGISDHIIKPQSMSVADKREMYAEAILNALERRRRRSGPTILYRWTAEKNVKFMIAMREEGGQRQFYLKPGLWRRWDVPSFCVGVQAGCRMGCRFCYNRDSRAVDLTPEQIIQQVEFSLNQAEFPLAEDEEFRLSFTNIGEPFATQDTFDNVWQAIRTLLFDKPYSSRIIDIRLSTVGIARRIGWLQRSVLELQRSADEKEREAGSKIILQIPATYMARALRREAMPASADFRKLLRIAGEYARETQSRVIVNHVLIGGPGRFKNDTREHALTLARKIKKVGGDGYGDLFEVQTTNLLVGSLTELQESQPGENEGPAVFATVIRGEGLVHHHMRVPPRGIEGVPGVGAPIYEPRKGPTKAAGDDPTR